MRNRKYKKVLTFLALIFVYSVEAIKRNKSLAILLNSLNVIRLFIIKTKVIKFYNFCSFSHCSYKICIWLKYPRWLTVFIFDRIYKTYLLAPLVLWLCCLLKGLNKSSNIVGRLLFRWSKTSMQLFKVIIRLSIFVSVYRSALDVFLGWNLLFLGLCFELFEPWLVCHCCLSPNLTCIM